MVGNAMKIPTSFSEYLNPKASTLNPANVGFKFYVYGVLPLTLNKILAVNLGNDNYNAFTIQGRFLSALADLLVVVLVYKAAELLINKKISNFKFQISNFPLWAAFFYAISVFPIQLSHFFAVDTFLNFFMLASFYCSLRYYYAPSKIERQNKESSRSSFAKATEDKQARTITWLFLSSVFFGLALACKITAVFILPLNLFFLALAVMPNLFRHPINLIKILKLVQDDKGKFLLYFIFYLLISYFTLRLADPYIFQSSNFFDPTPNKIFVENLLQQETFSSPSAVYYPPAIQWFSKKPFFFATQNIVFFGFGLVSFIFFIIGFILSLKLKKVEIYIIILWLITFFVYQSTRFSPSMRYFIFIYPFLAIFAGIGMQSLLNFVSNGKFLGLILIIILLIWPLMFSSIYLNKNSRVAASEWIYKNLPNGSFILSEHWDDGLPLPLENNYNKQFTGAQLPVFAEDTPEKWQQMNELFKKGDYYILSSNRGWGSITIVPKMYPKMSKFYKDLFAEKLDYKKIAEFTSYPSTCYLLHLFCFTFNDQWAEEAFTVYDHPAVTIFKKQQWNGYY